jgi:RNA polymerase sigma factor (sigma-70 family)
MHGDTDADPCTRYIRSNTREPSPINRGDPVTSPRRTQPTVIPSPEDVRDLLEVEPVVRAICRRRLGRDEGDDAAQTVLVRLWQAVVDGREIRDMRAYAISTANYQVMPDIRQLRRKAWATDHEEAGRWADPGPGPDEEAIRHEEAAHAAARVDELLATLSPRQVDVLRATALADRSCEDAGPLLGILTGSVRSTRWRAMERLRAMEPA